MRLTRAQIAAIAEKAKLMPPAPPAEVNVTKQEAVRLLAAEIAGLQRKGYTLEQIAESFRGDGLDLSTPTLKSYLSRAKAAKGRRKGALAPSQVSGRVAAPLTPKAAPAAAAADTPAKTGKSAFLVGDKDSY
jgi:hypothetical protein